jgi:Inner membrane protein YgaP-like, transmembrane domain
VNVEPAEYGLSAVIGTILLLAGLRRGSLPLLIGDGVLLHRGVTGVCPIYRPLESQAGTSLKDGLQIEPGFRS